MFGITIKPTLLSSIALGLMSAIGTIAGTYFK